MDDLEYCAAHQVRYHTGGACWRCRESALLQLPENRATMDSRGEAAADRVFWLQYRDALLMQVRAIERKYKLERK